MPHLPHTHTTLHYTLKWKDRRTDRQTYMLLVVRKENSEKKKQEKMLQGITEMHYPVGRHASCLSDGPSDWLPVMRICIWPSNDNFNVIRHMVCPSILPSISAASITGESKRIWWRGGGFAVHINLMLHFKRNIWDFYYCPVGQIAPLWPHQHFPEKQRQPLNGENANILW